MQNTTALRDGVLNALDSRFVPSGFRRRKGDQAWRRRIDPTWTRVIHLNFGLYEREGHVSITLSVGVRHDLIERALVASGTIAQRYSADRATFSKTLVELSGSNYASRVDDVPESVASAIWSDWEAFGCPFLDAISDIEAVIRMLRSPEARAWCCSGRSERARLLLLALQAAGRASEGLVLIAELRADLEGHDQMRPPFDQFAVWYRSQAEQGGATDDDG